MNQYNVIDPTLKQIARGDSTYPIVDGVVSLPDDLAADLLATGQIAKPEKSETKPASGSKAKGKKTDTSDKAE